MTDSNIPAIARWHDLVRNPQPESLHDLLAENVVLRSPAMYKPKEGRTLVEPFLWAALTVLAPTMTYEHEWLDTDSAVLLFTAEVDGHEVSGVDIVRWDQEDRLTEFTVMIRPLKGLETVVAAIGNALAAAA
ncbi:MAG: nuclear transport factor 2 family protein [Mycobacterium sp.]